MHLSTKCQNATWPLATESKWRIFLQIKLGKIKAWLWICSAVVRNSGEKWSMKFLLSLSLGPQQNNIFQHLNREEKALAASVTSEIQASETGSVLTVLWVKRKQSKLEPPRNRVSYGVELSQRQIHLQTHLKQFLLLKRLVKTHTHTLSLLWKGMRQEINSLMRSNTGKRDKLILVNISKADRQQ